MTREISGEVVAAWQRGKGALLYGPPGTGKTRALAELFARLQEDTGEDDVMLDPLDPDTPLLHEPRELPIPGPVKVVWTTFHQSYTYEDFVIGLRPEPTAHGVRLRPRLGVLLDALYELVRPDPEYGSVVLFVDELNRGNAARIFGELLTFLDVDYRDGSALRLPLPLPQVDVDGARTEPLARFTGEEVTLPVPCWFPRHVYLVATMNSVDRAAVPVDSALARRFDRIELRPDLDVLAEHFGLDLAALSSVAQQARAADSETWQRLTAHETAVLLLDRLNGYLAEQLGSEFELGHGLVMGAPSGDEEQRWRRLAAAWDETLYPQLEDRFAGRPEQLRELLKVEAAPGGPYAWRLRTGLGGAATWRALDPVSLVELDTDTVRRSLQWLAV